MTPDGYEFRVLQLWLLASEGQASPKQLDELDVMIVSDATARRAIFELAQQQGWLKWTGSRSLSAGLPAGGAALGHASDVECGNSSRDVAANHAERLGRGSQDSAQSYTKPEPAFANMRNPYVPILSLRMAAIAVCMFCLAYWVTALSSRVEEFQQHVENKVDIDNGIRAELISATPCKWSDSRSPVMSRGDYFEEGDALTLLEGVAELRIASRSGPVEVQLEGPVACVLGAEGIANLRYGKITITNTAVAARSFVVETSFGRVLVSPGAEVGISAFGSLAEIHVFLGSAVLDSPWLVSEEGELTSRAIETRSALRIAQGDDSAFEFSTLSADRAHFTPEVSSRGNFLTVPPAYVTEVKRSSPAAYWRFDGVVGNRVHNEVGEGFEGELLGDYRWVGPEENRSIEFGVLPHPGMMRVYDSWKEVLSGDFSMEFWMKPSHYHHGTVISLAGPFDWQRKKNPLGIAVETMGGWGEGASTNRIRFLLREPMGYFTNSSTYSSQLYSPRSWQHVVALRRGNEFQTYLDGSLVQSQIGKTTTPRDLTMVIGKLYTDELYRPYVGCLDEIAIYDHALSEDDVSRHYKSLKEEAKLPSDI